jgi:tellurite resistance protein TehA-like permease
MHFGKLKASLQLVIRGLSPDYFTLVMATGIVSIAAYSLGMSLLAWILLYINVSAFIVLWLLTLIRIFNHPRFLFDDFVNHARGPGFFSMIAGTCVLGSQLDLVAKESTAAVYLLYAGIVLWAIIIYAFFTIVTVNNPKPSLKQGLNGTWLVVTVATQSISILGSLVSPRYGAWQREVLFFSLIMYLIGLMLYLLIIGMIFYRWIFVDMSPEDLTPPYWINMGAVAITTLAGDTLILGASHWDFLKEIIPFLRGMTLFSWASGTWWIPLLFILGAWRHMYKKYPLKYNPHYWGMVFPLGMYTTCTFDLAKSMRLEFLFVIPEYFIYIALIAWSASIAGLIYSLIKGFYTNAIKPSESTSAP